MNNGMRKFKVSVVMIVVAIVSIVLRRLVFGGEWGLEGLIAGKGVEGEWLLWVSVGCSIVAMCQIFPSPAPKPSKAPVTS